jgi:hypothetical protein
MDPRFGLWQQAVHGTLTRQATLASRLWPRLHEWGHAAAAHVPEGGTDAPSGGGGIGVASGDGWWSNPFDDDDDDAGDNVEMQQALDRQVTYKTPGPLA